MMSGDTEGYCLSVWMVVLLVSGGFERRVKVKSGAGQWSWSEEPDMQPELGCRT